MADLNTISVCGRLTRDLDERAFGYVGSGTAKLNFSIAVGDGYGDKKYTNYFDVTVWGKPAESLKNYLGKGKQVNICGRLRQDRWESNGEKKSKVYIVAENVQLLGGGQSGSTQPAQASNNGADFPEDIPY